MSDSRKLMSEQKNTSQSHIISLYSILLNKGKRYVSDYKDFIVLMILCLLLAWNRIYTLEDWLWFFVGFAVLTPLTLYLYKKLL